MWGILGSRINKKPITAFLLSTILLLSATAGSQLNQYNAADAEATDKISVDQNLRLNNILSEPLLPSDTPVVRSFEYPTVRFNGKIASTVVETIIWYPSGMMTVSDTRGYQISMNIPASQGDVTLLQNSTMVAQKVIGSELEYTVYWKPVKNSEGYVDKWKFIIEGTSVGDSTVSFNLQTNQYLYAQGNRILATDSADRVGHPTQELDTARQVNGLGFDWSDAVTSGYQVQYDATKSAINIPVGKSFFIDPYVIVQVFDIQSPPGTDSFEGERRVLSVNNGTHQRLYAFWHEGGDAYGIMYKTSDDEGVTWSTNTTILADTNDLWGDTYRWSLTTTVYANTTYVILFYWEEDGTGSYEEFYAKRGAVNGLSINWSPRTLLFTALTFDNIYGAKAAVAPEVDTSGTVYAAFRWIPASGTYSYKILRSADGGASWTTSLDTVSTGETERITPMLIGLNNTKMLFLYTKYSDGNFYYRVFDGSAWATEQTLTGTGMTGNTFKQLSATTDGTGSAYIAYTNVTSSLGGILKVARFSNTGTFEAFETADSTLRHRLPNIMYNFNDDLNINSLANNEVYNTRKTNGIWESPFNPYGTSPQLPDQLTSTNILDAEVNSGLWRENIDNTLTLGVAVLEVGTIVSETSQQVSPKLADWFEGQRRVVTNSNGTMFSFYYDGSNIVYRKSFDLGHTWTGTPISTGTGTINSDNYRWSLAFSGHKGLYPDRIALLYYQVSGSNTKFWQKTFIANDGGLVLVSTVNTNTVANTSGCSSGVCAAAAGASDDNGNLFAAYKWKTSTDWKWRILRSTDGGSTWSVSHAAFSVASNFAMTLTSLSGTKMIFVFNRDSQADLKYQVFDGSTWGATNTVTAGISTGVAKQLSSATVNGTKQAYVAFLSGGNQGTLKVARFSGNGVFEAIETADSTLTHRLPSIAVTYDDDVRIYSIYNNKVYETMKNSSGWQAPTTPFGTYFESVDQLTAPILDLINIGVSWTEQAAAPYVIIYAAPVKITADSKFTYGHKRWGLKDGSSYSGSLGTFFFCRNNDGTVKQSCNSGLIDGRTNFVRQVAKMNGNEADKLAYVLALQGTDQYGNCDSNLPKNSNCFKPKGADTHNKKFGNTGAGGRSPISPTGDHFKMRGQFIWFNSSIPTYSESKPNGVVKANLLTDFWFHNNTNNDNNVKVLLVMDMAWVHLVNNGNEWTKSGTAGSNYTSYRVEKWNPSPLHPANCIYVWNVILDSSSQPNQWRQSKLIDVSVYISNAFRGQNTVYTRVATDDYSLPQNNCPTTIPGGDQYNVNYGWLDIETGLEVFTSTVHQDNFGTLIGAYSASIVQY